MITLYNFDFSVSALSYTVHSSADQVAGHLTNTFEDDALIIKFFNATDFRCSSQAHKELVEYSVLMQVG